MEALVYTFLLIGTLMVRVRVRVRVMVMVMVTTRVRVGFDQDYSCSFLETIVVH